jgi:hypothetical protein
MSTAQYFLKIFLDPLIIVPNNGYFFDMPNSALLPAGVPALPQNWRDFNLSRGLSNFQKVVVI